MVLFFYLFYFFQFCSFVILVNKILKLVCCYLQVLWVTQKVKFWKLSCSKLNFNFVLTSFDFVNRAHHELMLIIMYSSRCIHSYINKWNFEKKRADEWQSFLDEIWIHNNFGWIIFLVIWTCTISIPNKHKQIKLEFLYWSMVSFVVSFNFFINFI